MKRLMTRCAVFGAGLMWTSFALAAQPQLAAPVAPQADTTDRGTMAAYFDDAEEKTRSCCRPRTPSPSEAAPRRRQRLQRALVRG